MNILRSVGAVVLLVMAPAVLWVAQREPGEGSTIPNGFSGLLGVLLLSACAAPSADTELPQFTPDVAVSVRVLENSTACTVDAECYLRLEFADSTIVALYGTGERPAPPCEITTEVSDQAFAVGQGDFVTVVISRCGLQRWYVSEIRRGTGEASR